MATIIPVNNSGDRIFSISLGDNTIKIRTYFNSVIDYWFADFYTETDTPILLGATLKSGINILGIRTSIERQYGQIRMTRSAQGVNSLGNTAKMIWLSNDEFTEPELDASTLPLTYDFDALFPVVQV